MGKIVECRSYRQILRHTGMNHCPDSEASGHAVEYGHESAKKSNVRARSVDA